MQITTNDWGHESLTHEGFRLVKFMTNSYTLYYTNEIDPEKDNDGFDMYAESIHMPVFGHTVEELLCSGIEKVNRHSEEMIEEYKEKIKAHETRIQKNKEIIACIPIKES